jgi:hypothetical protein
MHILGPPYLLPDDIKLDWRTAEAVSDVIREDGRVGMKSVSILLYRDEPA